MTLIENHMSHIMNHDVSPLPVDRPMSGGRQEWRICMNLTFEAMQENRPGSKWQTAFRRHWPGWKAWYLTRRDNDAPSLARI